MLLLFKRIFMRKKLQSQITAPPKPEDQTTQDSQAGAAGDPAAAAGGKLSARGEKQHAGALHNNGANGTSGATHVQPHPAAAQDGAARRGRPPPQTPDEPFDENGFDDIPEQGFDDIPEQPVAAGSGGGGAVKAARYNGNRPGLTPQHLSGLLCTRGLEFRIYSSAVSAASQGNALSKNPAQGEH